MADASRYQVAARAIERHSGNAEGCLEKRDSFQKAFARGYRAVDLARRGARVYYQLTLEDA